MNRISFNYIRNWVSYYTRRISIVFILIIFFTVPVTSLAQTQQDILNFNADLNTCVKYALNHQPLIQQLQLSEDITRQDVRIALSDWFPQLNASAGLQHYLKQPVSIFPDFTNPSGPKREITTGVLNTSSLQFSANQVLYNNDVLIAAKSDKYYKLKSTQTTREQKINLVVEVSKAFYDVLLSEANQDFLSDDIVRIDKSMKDAYNQYKTGVSDKIDYQRALISINNLKSEIYATQETIRAKYTRLKELMGYPQNEHLTIERDTLDMFKSFQVDTAVVPDYHNRIEYNLLITQLKLQKFTMDYYKTGFLPSLSAFANYNLVFQNDQFNDLYKQTFPNSIIGLSLSFPIFEGTRRIQQLKRAHLQYREMALDTINLKNSINTELDQAMAAYKSNLKAYKAASENVRIADEVYNTVKFQYDQGIKAFLEVIVSETDLRTSRINELNALYRLLSSKLDLDKALGNISVNY